MAILAILPKNMVHLSISSCHIQCLSSVSYSLGKFILRYCIPFDAMVIKSLISLSGSLLLVYRNAADFCILILCPEILLNSLMNSSNFLVAPLGFST